MNRGHMSSHDRSLGVSSLATGAAAGAIAYVLGYLFAYLTQGSQVEDQLAGLNLLADLFGSDPIPTWQGVGWLFYNGHFVNTEITLPIGGVRTVNLIAEADGGSLTLLYIIPPVLLGLAGVAAARYAGASDLAAGAQSGALVGVGYLPLAIGGAFLFRYGDGAVAPDLVTAVLLAGAVYPVAFGALGGVLGAVLAD